MKNNESIEWMMQLREVKKMGMPIPETYAQGTEAIMANISVEMVVHETEYAIGIF